MSNRGVSASMPGLQIASDTDGSSPVKTIGDTGLALLICAFAQEVSENTHFPGAVFESWADVGRALGGARSDACQLRTFFMGWTRSNFELTLPLNQLG